MFNYVYLIKTPTNAHVQITVTVHREQSMKIEDQDDAELDVYY